MIRIVILDKGFVSVGKYSETEDRGVLENACVIRRWGTTAGLGEIAANGPTQNTILDKTPTQRFPMHAVINTIECNTKNWKKALGL